jgi:hypothetical protein
MQGPDGQAEVLVTSLVQLEAPATLVRLLEADVSSAGGVQQLMPETIVWAI